MVQGLGCIGSDNYNAMRGLYFDLVVLDEPSNFPVNAWPTVIRACLSDRNGRAVFIVEHLTAKNQFWEIYNNALTDPNWFVAMYKSSETNLLDKSELEEAEKAMGEDRFMQEFECSFEAATIGAYYGNEMKTATSEGRITNVPYDKAAGVVVSFDLGIGDSTSIWFAQYIGQEIHLIDYYESSGVGLDHYAKVLADKGYHYTDYIFPHDVQARELGTGKSRLETLEALGIRNTTIAPRLSVDDGIQAARSMLNRCWFDEVKCERGIEALRQYRREFDEKLKLGEEGHYMIGLHMAQTVLDIWL